MSKNLLNGTNEVLKRVQIVSNESLLTSLSNSGKQIFIDLAIQAWNEAIDQLYSKASTMMPLQGAESSITLVADKRTYTLEDDLIQLRWPFHDETNGYYITEYPGGYEEMRHAIVQPDNYTGLPFQGAISPLEDKQLYLISSPTASDAGNTYKYLYWRDTVLERESDTFPFNDGVFRALVPVVAEIWRLMMNNKYVEGISKLNYGRALRMVKEQPSSEFYVKRVGVRSRSPIGFDPLGD